MKGHKELLSSLNKTFGDGYKHLKELLETKTKWEEEKEKFYIQIHIKEDSSKDSKPGSKK